MSKQFHIISIGNSVIRNFKSSQEGEKWGISKIPFSDESSWERLLSSPEFMGELFSFLSKDPQRRSGELNSFFKVVKEKDPKEVFVYLIGTNSNSNRICRIAIQRVLEARNFNISGSEEVLGYFSNISQNDFRNSITNLVKRIYNLALIEQTKGYQIFINPTGGFKSHVIASALAGLLVGAIVYYVHEEAQELVILPSLGEIMDDIGDFLWIL